jgi:hypothetical protein
LEVRDAGLQKPDRLATGEETDEVHFGRTLASLIARVVLPKHPSPTMTKPSVRNRSVKEQELKAPADSRQEGAESRELKAES